MRVSQLAAASNLFVDPQTPKPKVKFNRSGDGLFVELISGDKLFDMMKEKRVDVAKLVKKSGLSESAIRKYLADEQTTISSKALDKLAKALRCSPLALIPETGVPVEKVLPLPQPPKVVDLQSEPLPQFKEGAAYIFRKKSAWRGQQPDQEERSSIFRYVGSHKGNGITHFMFQSVVGKYLVTYTDIDFKCGAVLAIATDEARRSKKKKR